jgi:protein-disulfide isomerase
MSSRAEQKAQARAAREAAEQEAAQAERRRKRLLTVGGILAAAVVVIVAVVLVTGSGSGDGSKGTAAPERIALFDGIPQQGPWLGRADAPVIVEEYADLQCPYCAAFAREQLPSIVRDSVRPGDVRMRLRMVSILGPDSEKAAAVFDAARLQNRAWQFAEAVYTKQGPEGTGYMTDEYLRARAEEAGVDVQRAFADRDSPAVLRAMSGDEQAFSAAHLGGTPSFRVGRRGGPLHTVESTGLTAAIRAELERAGGTSTTSG